jgi:hypothetical protein
MQMSSISACSPTVSAEAATRDLKEAKSTPLEKL